MPQVVEEIGEWLDASKVDLLHLCPQKYFWRIESGLVPLYEDPINPMSFGFALHAGLESLYDGSGFEMSTCPCPTFEGCRFCKGLKIPKFLVSFLINYPEDPQDERDPRTQLRGVEILCRYIEKWKTDQFDVIAVEVPFTIPFREFNFIGRIDLVGRWKDSQRLFPNDHKSTTRFGDLFDQQFKLSIQMTGYIVALESIMHEEVNEAQINAIRVTTKIDEDSFKRILTSRSPEEKERWKQEIQSAWEMIKHHRATGFWPRHAPYACSAYFRRCEYYALCTSGPATQEDLIRNSFEYKPWTPISDD